MKPTLTLPYSLTILLFHIFSTKELKAHWIEMSKLQKTSHRIDFCAKWNAILRFLFNYFLKLLSRFKKVGSMTKLNIDIETMNCRTGDLYAYIMSSSSQNWSCVKTCCLDTQKSQAYESKRVKVNPFPQVSSEKSLLSNDWPTKQHFKLTYFLAEQHFCTDIDATVSLFVCYFNEIQSEMYRNVLMVAGMSAAWYPLRSNWNNKVLRLSCSGALPRGSRFRNITEKCRKQAPQVS